MVFVFNPNPGDITFAIIGGVLLSIATSMNLLLKGRGCCGSSIFNGLITMDERTRQWKLSFLSGLVLATTVLFLSFEYDKVACFMKMQFFEEPLKMVQHVGLFGFLLAGFLMGFGARLARGCAVGHWITGIPRFSQRSWCAVAVITPVAVVVSTLRFKWKWLFFLTQGTDFLKYFAGIEFVTAVVFLVLACLAFLGQLVYIEAKVEQKQKEKQRTDRIVSFFVGIIFGAGLVFAGMMRRSKFVDLLTLDDQWDPSILISVMTCIVINFFTHYFIIDVQKKPTLECCFDETVAGAGQENKDKVDGRLLAGSIILGIGWGIVGFCVLPALGLVPIFTPHISLVFVNSLAVGQLLAMKLEDQLGASNSKAGAGEADNDKKD